MLIHHALENVGTGDANVRADAAEENVVVVKCEQYQLRCKCREKRLACEFERFALGGVVEFVTWVRVM